MTDTKDAIVEARVRIKKIAASMLVRKEGLESELKKLMRDRAELREKVAAAGAGEPEFEAELEDMLVDLEQQIAIKDEALAVAESDLKGALKELDELGGVQKQSERAVLRAIVDGASGGDPVIRSVEENALDNVRNHISDLDAMGRMSGAGAASAKDRREMSEAETKAKLAELKAKKARDRGESPAAAGEDPESGDEAPAPGKPKRTL